MFKSITKEQAKKLVLEILKKSGKRLSQELQGDNEEFLDRLLRQFKTKIARCSWKKSQYWCKWDNDGPILMPDFTRIYYTKGNTEVLVQEFAPQIRLLKFKGDLVFKSNNFDVIENKADLAKVFNYSLSLPYVVFIFKFVDGLFAEVKCSFLDKPLKNLQEKPLKPYLPNIDSNLNVCLGSGFDKSMLEKGNVTQQSALVLNYFWNSVFSNEWADHYWYYRSYFQKGDIRLSNLDSWQSNSMNDPLFVIDGVNWVHNSDFNYGDTIVKMFDNDKKNIALQEELYQELSEDFLKEVVKIINENIENLNNRPPENLVDQLADYLVSNS